METICPRDPYGITYFGINIGITTQMVAENNK